MHRLVWILAATLVLGGCSVFKKDRSDEGKPRDLKSINAEVDIRTVWSKKIGRGAKDKAIRLVPAVSGGRIFAAAAGGSVRAMQLDTGKEIWKVDVLDFYATDERKAAFGKDVDAVTGGVGAGGDLIAMGTAAGEVLALNQSDGSLAWRARTTSELLAPPQIDLDIVVVQTIDGRVAAYDAVTGTRRWVYSSVVPSLTLRGTATPIVTNEFIVAAFASGRIAFLDRRTGLAAFEQRVSVSQGRSDLEKLVDIDGNMVIVGSRLYVVGYQGRLVAFNITTGRVEWGQDASSVVGLGEGFGNIYLAHADSRSSALDADDGDQVWDNDALLNREITTPVTISSFVVVGDYKGIVHVLAQVDGRFVGRRTIDGDGLYSPAVEAGNRLYIMGNSGTLSALEIR